LREFKTENEYRHDICEIGRLLHQKGMVAATDGNVSVRLPGGDILATPTGMSKGLMRPEDLVVVDAEGHKLLGHRNPSSEMGMHLLIYRRRPDVHAVVHAHPPTATGYAAAGIALDKALISEVVLGLGCVPLAAYGTPGTPELADTLKEMVPRHDALLMANHGVVTYGADLMSAYFRMETVEHFARISLVTEVLGRQVLLSARDVDKLMEARQRYMGLDSTPSAAPGCPVTADGGACPVGAAAQAPAAVAAHSGAEGQRFSVTREELLALVDSLVRARSGKA
jgi:L-fuculose-phosphate aldolase